MVLKAGDRVQFIPRTTAFLPASETHAICISIVAVGVIEALVESPESLPGRRRYTGCYIKWRVADDGKGGSSPDDRIFNLFVGDVEARYVLPGMRARVTPMLVMKKSTKRLNLTSKFGSFECLTEGIVSELPDGFCPSPAMLALGPRSREGSNSSSGSASSASLVSVGKIKISKQSPGTSMNFTYGDVATPLDRRALRSGDRVELKFSPDPPAASIKVVVTVILEGIVRKVGDTATVPAEDDFYCNSDLEIVSKADDSPQTAAGMPDSETSYAIDPMIAEAICGFLPLRIGDRVRFHVNGNGHAESISVVSEVPGRIRTVGTVVLRNDPSSVALYPPKTFTKLGSGTFVLTRIDWQDTHFRILQMRVDSAVVSKNLDAAKVPKNQIVRNSSGKLKRNRKQQPQSQQPLAAGVPRPTIAYVDKAPPQPNVKFHGTNPLRVPNATDAVENPAKPGWAACVLRFLSPTMLLIGIVMVQCCIFASAT